MKQRVYVAIDLKSFYASVECQDRGLDPLRTHLVVADRSRTEKTICLAVSPSLKVYGIPGRARLFEVEQRVRQVNAERQSANGGRPFNGASADSEELAAQPDWKVDFVVAPPQMAHYMEVSTRIYQIYLRYVAPGDIHVYSIDEVMMDVTDYLIADGISQTDERAQIEAARVLTARMLRDVLAETGLTAAAGIGTNLYLCKVAMDIVAKHVAADADGARIAVLNERSYRELLWGHKPLTDFWRVGGGYAKKLQAHGLETMGDIARCSLGGPNDYYNEELLYRMFGVNAELLIDHAWGVEPCRMADIKAYRPEGSSIGSGQVLSCAYDFDHARLVLHEMIDQLSLTLLEKQFVTDQIVLTVGYDIENLRDEKRKNHYHGELKADRYGRILPKSGHGSENLPKFTSSAHVMTEAALRLFDRITDPTLLVRRLYLTANHVQSEDEVKQKQQSDGGSWEQMDLFSDFLVDPKKKQAEEQEEQAFFSRERKAQEAMLEIRKKFGKNAMLKGMNLPEGATARERNAQIGGHRAGNVDESIGKGKKG